MNWKSFYVKDIDWLDGAVSEIDSEVKIFDIFGHSRPLGISLICPYQIQNLPHTVYNSTSIVMYNSLRWISQYSTAAFF